jgi:predicted phosphodiesterase
MPDPISRNKADFQVMSDLHLELSNQYSTFSIPPAAPFLILAGDIGQLANYESFLVFLRAQCRQFSRVFLVLSNHEFYGLSRDEGLRRAACLEQEPDLAGRLTVLNRTRVTLEEYDVTILGCTLHSLIPPEAEEAVRGRVKDFQRIENWTVASHNKEHCLDVAWLESQIKLIRDDKNTSGHKILVVTHHAPSVQESSSPRHSGNPWGSAFATDLLGNEDKPALSDVQWWIFGHTHFCTEFSKANVRVVSNQRGYVMPEAAEKQAPTSFFQSLVRKTKLLSTNSQSTFQVKKVIRI